MPQKKTFEELRSTMIQRYDANAGEIINGFQEMGLKGQKLCDAMERYIARVPAYEEAQKK